MKAYVRLRVTSPLVLIKLEEPGLARLGASAEVVHGGLPYDTHKLGRQLCAATLSMQGLLRIALIMMARRIAMPPTIIATAVVEEHQEIRLEEDWFWDLAEPYRVGLAP